MGKKALPIELVGTHAVTLQPELLSSLIYHPLTDSAVFDFSKDWRECYGRKYIVELLKDMPPIE